MGIFLVNRQPASILPKLINLNKNVVKIFKNQIFIAHSDGIDRYSTNYRQSELGYNFYLTDELIIEEIPLINEIE